MNYSSLDPHSSAQYHKSCFNFPPPASASYKYGVRERADKKWFWYSVVIRLHYSPSQHSNVEKLFQWILSTHSQYITQHSLTNITYQLIQSMTQCLQSKQGRHGLSLIYNFIVSVFVARINRLKMASHSDPPTPNITSQNRMKNLLFSHLQRCNISAQTYFL